MTTLPPFPSLPENVQMEEISVSSSLSGPSSHLYVVTTSDTVPARPSPYPTRGLQSS